jgi:hypothetical protein
MSIPPVPNHPPRPGRRKPAEESPESITTQLFIGQDGSAAADGSTQALTPEELQRLQSMVDSDGTQATEVLSLEELRQLAAADGYETGGLPAAPRKANSDDIAAAEAASAPKQWNPQGASPASPDTDEAGPAHPNPAPWGPEFGAAGQTEAAAEPMRSAGAPASAGALHSQGGQAPGRPEAGPVRPESGSGGQQPAYGSAYAAAPAAGPAYGASGPGGPGGPTGPGGPGGPMGPGGPYGDRPETKKVPAWLWVLASIALVLALGIVGYIVWDSTQGTDEVTAPPSDQPTTGRTDPQPSASDSSSPPVAEEVFTSPSGNISCTIDAERARCVINDYDYSPPQKPDDCRLDDWGSIVVANDEGAGFSCLEAPESEGPARVLGYGDSISAAGMTCTSSEEGMECTSDESGVGFNVRRASVDFLK